MKSRLRLRVTSAAESHVRAGHPWIYEASIREQNREGQAGEFAIIYDRRDRFLAIGIYDPESVIRVRILHTRKPTQLDQSWWQARLSEAFTKRFAVFGAPQQDQETTGYRLINGESDGLPGMVLDRYANVAVLKIYTAAWLMHLPMLHLLFQELLPKEWTIVIRISRNIQTEAAQQGIYDGQILGTHQEYSDSLNPVIFKENGLSFEADVKKGQKTGFFLDQRDNRRHIQTLSQGKTVLNAFSFNGGFSVYAACGGASSVSSLDISRHALEGAKRNWALNGLDTPHELIQADVFQWIGTQQRLFDIIILDPPSLARREHERQRAIAAYSRLARAAVRQLRPHGILLSASCSAHVSSAEFFTAVRTAVGDSFHELMTTQHAFDHKATLDEAQYLKAIYLQKI